MIEDPNIKKTSIPQLKKQIRVPVWIHIKKIKKIVKGTH